MNRKEEADVWSLIIIYLFYDNPLTIIVKCSLKFFAKNGKLPIQVIVLYGAFNIRSTFFFYVSFLWFIYLQKQFLVVY